jgi:polyferredoxin
MKAQNNSPWADSQRLAQGILRHRDQRRKWLGMLLLVPLMMLAGGLWLLGDWLQASALRFLLWWGGCAVFTGLLMVFALYDALAVIREERSKPDD